MLAVFLVVGLFHRLHIEESVIISAYRITRPSTLRPHDVWTRDVHGEDPLVRIKYGDSTLRYRGLPRSFLIRQTEPSSRIISILSSSRYLSANNVLTRLLHVTEILPCVSWW